MRVSFFQNQGSCHEIWGSYDKELFYDWAYDKELFEDWADTNCTDISYARIVLLFNVANPTSKNVCIFHNRTIHTHIQDWLPRRRMCVFSTIEQYIHTFRIGYCGKYTHSSLYCSIVQRWTIEQYIHTFFDVGSTWDWIERTLTAQTYHMHVLFYCST